MNPEHTGPGKVARRATNESDPQTLPPGMALLSYPEQGPTIHSCSPEKLGACSGGRATWVCLYKKNWLNWPNQHIHLLLGGWRSRGCYQYFLPWVLGLSEESREALCGESIWTWVPGA